MSSFRRYSGLEKFCPIYATYRAPEASRPVDGDMVERAGLAVAATLDELNEEARSGTLSGDLEEAEFRKTCSERLARAALEAAGIASLLQQKEEAERDLLNLLATIHRDGGQYAAEHGREKAVQDAIVLSSERIGALENLFEACRIHDPDDWTGEPAMIEAALILKKPPFDKEPKQ